jgi:DNA-binding beta-propeller fold protein YncE
MKKGIGDEEQANIIGINISLTDGEPSSSVTFTVPTNGAPAGERCLLASGDKCRQGDFGTEGEGVGEFVGPHSVAVDQVTGDVYVLDPGRKKEVVQVYSAGSEHHIGGFGEKSSESLGGAPGSSPEKVREPVSIGVDSLGDVFVVDDGESASGSESRVMVFRPVVPGNMKNMCMVGRLRGNVGVSHRMLRLVQGMMFM